MSTKQTAKKKKDNLAELDALVGPSSKKTSNKPKQLQNTDREGIEILGKSYKKSELLAKFLQASGTRILSNQNVQDNCKAMLLSDKFMDLLPEDMKSEHLRIGKVAFEMLREQVEYQLTDLFYIANVMSVAKGKATINESDVLLARLIQTKRLYIHGDKEATHEALKLCHPSKEIELGKNVNIDQIASILQEAFRDGLSVSSISQANKADLRKVVSAAEKRKLAQTDLETEEDIPKKKKKSTKKSEKKDEKKDEKSEKKDDKKLEGKSDKVTEEDTVEEKKKEKSKRAKKTAKQ